MHALQTCYSNIWWISGKTARGYGLWSFPIMQRGWEACLGLQCTTVSVSRIIVIWSSHWHSNQSTNITRFIWTWYNPFSHLCTMRRLSSITFICISSHNSQYLWTIFTSLKVIIVIFIVMLGEVENLQIKVLLSTVSSYKGEKLYSLQLITNMFFFSSFHSFLRVVTFYHCFRITSTRQKI